MNQLLTAEKLTAEAKHLYQQEEYLDAADRFAQASQAYTDAKDHLAAAEMDNNRSVSLLQAGEYQQAHDAVGQTDRIFADAGDVRRQAMALGNRAAALARLGKKEAAKEMYWESARLLGEIGDNDLRSSVLQAISKLQLSEGRVMEAISSMESGLSNAPKLSLTQRLLKKLVGIPGKLLNR